jgi:hypothetical protein
MEPGKNFPAGPLQNDKIDRLGKTEAVFVTPVRMKGSGTISRLGPSTYSMSSRVSISPDHDHRVVRCKSGCHPIK